MFIPTALYLLAVLFMLGWHAWYVADGRAMCAPTSSYGDAQAWADQLDADLDALEVDAGWASLHDRVMWLDSVMLVASVDRRRAIRAGLDYAPTMRPRALVSLASMCLG